jgi:hypothetical protein
LGRKETRKERDLEREERFKGGIGWFESLLEQITDVFLAVLGHFGPF